MNVTLMNPDPMNLWTRDRWNESGVSKMKDGKDPDPSADQNEGWKSDKNHLVHPEVQFVRIQWRKTGVGEWINGVGHRLHILKEERRQGKEHKKLLRHEFDRL